MKRPIFTLFAVTAFASAFSFACVSSALAYESPGRPTGFVNDFAGIFTAPEKTSLETKLSAFEKETSAEISVVTLKSLGGDTAQNFGTRLFEEWGIGKKDRDNGLLFLIVPAEREARIEVGYGLEPTVTDAAASVILRNIVFPAFRDGKYFEGVQAGTDKIIGIIRNDPEAMKFVADASTTASTGNQSFEFWQAVLIGLIIIIIISTKRGRKMLPFIFWGGIGRGGFGGGNPGGGFGGGFGGFGGGSSGGGGAGGKW